VINILHEKFILVYTGLKWKQPLGGQHMGNHKSIFNIKEKLRQELPLLMRQYNIRSLGVFGSYVRHGQRIDSDSDILVSFK